MPEHQDLLSEKETQGSKLAEAFVTTREIVREQKLRDEWILNVIGDWCESGKVGPRGESAGDYLRARIRRMQSQGIEWYENEKFREKLLYFMALGWKNRLESGVDDRTLGMLLRDAQLLEEGVTSGKAIVTVEEHG